MDQYRPMQLRKCIALDGQKRLYFIDLLINLKKVQFYRQVKYFARTLVQRKGLRKRMKAKVEYLYSSIVSIINTIIKIIFKTQKYKGIL